MTQLNSKAILVSHLFHSQSIKTNNFGRRPSVFIIVSYNEHISDQNPIYPIEFIFKEHISLDYFVKLTEEIRLTFRITPNINVEALKVALKELWMQSYPLVKLDKRKARLKITYIPFLMLMLYFL